MLRNTEELVAEWIARVEVEQGVSSVIGERAKCEETGEFYVELFWLQSGDFTWIDANVSKDVAHFETDKLAWELWVVAFDRYREGRKGKIHWRCRPELHHWDDVGYMVYARLFIEEG